MPLMYPDYSYGQGPQRPPGGLAQMFQQPGISQMLLQLGASLMGANAARDPGGAMGAGLSSGMQAMMQQQLLEEQRQQQQERMELAQRRMAMAEENQAFQVAQRQQQEAAELAASTGLNDALSQNYFQESAVPGSTDMSMAERDVFGRAAERDPIQAAGLYDQRVLQGVERDRLEGEEAEQSKMILSAMMQDPGFASFAKGLPPESLESLDTIKPMWDIFRDQQRRLDAAAARGDANAARALLLHGQQVTLTDSKLRSYKSTQSVPRERDGEIVPNEFDEIKVWDYPGNPKLGIPAQILPYGSPEAARNMAVYAGIEAQYAFDPVGAQAEAKSLLARMEVVEGGKRDAGTGLLDSFEAANQSLTEGYAQGGAFRTESAPGYSDPSLLPDPNKPASLWRMEPSDVAASMWRNRPTGLSPDKWGATLHGGLEATSEQLGRFPASENPIAAALSPAAKVGSVVAGGLSDTSQFTSEDEKIAVAAGRLIPTVVELVGSMFLGGTKLAGQKGTQALAKLPVIQAGRVKTFNAVQRMLTAGEQKTLGAAGPIRQGASSQAGREAIEAGSQRLLETGVGRASAPFRQGASSLERTGQRLLTEGERKAVNLLDSGNPLPQEALSHIPDQVKVELFEEMARRNMSQYYDQALIWMAKQLGF